MGMAAQLVWSDKAIDEWEDKLAPSDGPERTYHGGNDFISDKATLPHYCFVGKLCPKIGVKYKDSELCAWLYWVIVLAP